MRTPKKPDKRSDGFKLRFDGKTVHLSANGTLAIICGYIVLLAVIIMWRYVH